MTWDVGDYASAVASVSRTVWTSEQVARARSTAHSAYDWGTGCRGWHIADREDLSVILEQMPPGAAEIGHAHRYARQFFAVITGTGTMQLAGDHDLRLATGSTLEVPAGAWHRLVNSGDTALLFVVVSSPHSHGDRTAAPRPS